MSYTNTDPDPYLITWAQDFPPIRKANGQVDLGFKVTLMEIAALTTTEGLGIPLHEYLDKHPEAERHVALGRELRLFSVTGGGELRLYPRNEVKERLAAEEQARIDRRRAQRNAQARRYYQRKRQTQQA